MAESTDRSSNLMGSEGRRTTQDSKSWARVARSLRDAWAGGGTSLRDVLPGAAKPLNSEMRNLGDADLAQRRRRFSPLARISHR